MFEYKYISDIVLYLLQDPTVMQHFTKSTILSLADIESLEAALKGVGEANKLLLVIPLNTKFNYSGSVSDCAKKIGNFYIAVFTPCIKDTVVVERRALGELEIKGNFWEASTLRGLVLDKVSSMQCNLSFDERGPYSNIRILELDTIRKEKIEDCNTSWLIAGARLEVTIDE